MQSKSLSLILGIVCLSVGSVYGQSPNSSNSSSSSSSPSAQSAASPGSATIENQMIAYEVLRQMAGQIAGEVSDAAARKDQAFCTASKPGAVLLADASALFEISAYKSFTLSADFLKKAYASAGGVSVEAFDASGVAALLTAIKNTASYTNQSFQPTTQSMNTLLTLAMKDKGYSLRTVAFPGDIEAAAKKIQDTLNEISQARAASNDGTRTKLDPEFAALRTALLTSTPDGTLMATIIKGRALLSSLKGQGNEDKSEIKFCVLTVSVDGAGGDTRTAHWFLQELIMPTPRPSYNGGAVVSFLLTDNTGTVLAGDMLHYMYGFSKWNNPKVPKSYNSSPPKP